MTSLEAQSSQLTSDDDHPHTQFIIESLNNPLVKAIAAVIAWAVLYGPVYLSLSRTAWARPENGHAPFIIAICAGLTYAILSRPGMRTNQTIGATIIGSVLVMCALALFGFARVQEIDLVLTATQPIIGLGLILIFLGLGGVRRLWFVLVLSLYLITWPGWMIDLLTFPLKMLVSEIVSNMLFSLGMPVTHNGAIIQVGAYSLLVADACAGLNSLIALTSIGAVYVYAARRGGWPVALVVAALLIPIAVFANIVRVAMLVAITYYFGYDAGQGFLHEFSGLVMFVAALLTVFLVEAMAFYSLQYILKNNRGLIAKASVQNLPSGQGGESKLLNGIGYLSCTMMIGVSLILGSVVLNGNNGNARATAGEGMVPPNLEQVLPDEFGEWSKITLSDAVLPPGSSVGPGEAIAYRAYRNPLGRIVTLVVAYGPPASDTVRLHRPEKCYVGQGFHIQRRPRGKLSALDFDIPVNRLMTRNAARHEAVSYWLRAGDDYAVSAAAHQWINLRQGFGQRADGVLVRISTIGQSPAEFDLHLTFGAALLAAMDPADRALLVAGPKTPA